MDAAAIDAVRLNFNPSGLLALNAVIGLMMFGIALDLKLADFTRIIKKPKAPAIGLAAQFILLPAFTFLLTLVLPIAPSIALGMILVAACPGGNLSNMMTYLAGGNAAVSVSMTAVSTAAAVIMTPLNLAVWGSLNPRTEPILREVSLNPLDVFFTIVMILGIPMVLGMIVGRFFPGLVGPGSQALQDLRGAGLPGRGGRGPGGQLGQLPQVRGPGGPGGGHPQRQRPEPGLLERPPVQAAPPRHPGGGHRGGHPELGPGAHPGVRLFRRPGGHGHHHRLVGGVAHHRRAGRGHLLVAASHCGGSGMSFDPHEPRSVLITGAGGYLGRQVVENLAADPGSLQSIVAMDLRPEPEASRLPGVTYVEADVRDPGLPQLIAQHRPQVVVHLAALVTPGKKSDRRMEYEVDVLGTERVLQGSQLGGAEKIIYSSSGAAYGYHADNPAWLREDDALRGNVEFAYSDHKRLVEEMLARWREDHPKLAQLILRPGVILGTGTANQITALFDKPLLLGVVGSETPFTIIWDQDAVQVIRRGLFSTATGIYNLSGDGAITMREIAAILGKTYLPLPAGLLKGALWLLKRLGLTQYGPEQVGFLQYRPVLANDRLKEVMGYIPAKTSREVFEYYLAHRDDNA